jgi:hypothetical protein
LSRRENSALDTDAANVVISDRGRRSLLQKSMRKAKKLRIKWRDGGFRNKSGERSK